MIFSKYDSSSQLPKLQFTFELSLLRLRQELAKLITSHTDKITDIVARATAQAKLYDAVLRGLSVSPLVTILRVMSFVRLMLLV